MFNLTYNRTRKINRGMVTQKLNPAKPNLGLAPIKSRLARFVITSGVMIDRRTSLQTPEDYDLPFEEVIFESIDGLKLAGWFIASPAPKATLILAHGYRHNKAYFLAYAHWLWEAGYNLFMFDFRAHGQSAGPMGTSIGYLERLDILGALHYLFGHGEQKIGILGVSMGASAAIMAAAESTNLAFVIADSPYAQLHRSITNMIKRRRHLPTFLARLAAYYAVSILAQHHGFDPAKAQPLDYIRQVAADRPIFLIHGENDRLTGVENSRMLYERTQHRASLWTEPGIDHVQMFKTFPNEYRTRILAFLESATRQEVIVQAA